MLVSVIVTVGKFPVGTPGSVSDSVVPPWTVADQLTLFKVNQGGRLDDIVQSRIVAKVKVFAPSKTDTPVTVTKSRWSRRSHFPGW